MRERVRGMAPRILTAASGEMELLAEKGKKDIVGEAGLYGREGSDQKYTFGQVNFEMLLRYQKRSWIALPEVQGKVPSRDRNLEVIRSTQCILKPQDWMRSPSECR